MAKVEARKRICGETEKGLLPSRFDASPDTNTSGQALRYRIGLRGHLSPYADFLPLVSRSH